MEELQYGINTLVGLLFMPLVEYLKAVLGIDKPFFKFLMLAALSAGAGFLLNLLYGYGIDAQGIITAALNIAMVAVGFKAFKKNG